MHKKFEANSKDLMYDDPNDNKSYLLGLKTNDGDDKELQDVKSQKYSGNFDRFIIYEAKKEGEDNIIGKYDKILKLDDILKLIDDAYKSKKSIWLEELQLIISQITYISIGLISIMRQKSIKKQWIKWRIHQNSKWKRVVKLRRSKMAYERYQIDLVELSRELNMNGKFKYLLTWVNHFSKCIWALPIKNKDAVTVRNTIV